MPINLIDPIKLQVKDPTYSLIEEIPIPHCPEEMPFMVIGWDGSGKDVDTHAGRAAACYYVMATSIPYAINLSGKKLMWIGTKRLMIQPAVGFSLNANYDRRYLNFFFDWDQPRKKMVYAAASIDVVAHELGHALLDSLRPDLWNFAVPEIAALHETFADIHGITTVMRQKKVLEKAIEETNGDINLSNIISQVGIEMGTSYFKLSEKEKRSLRDASIFFPYVDSNLLPAKADYGQLSTEPHSLSRVFTGAAYAIMVGMYSKILLQGFDRLKALEKAGRDLMEYFFKAIQIAPAGRNMFQNMAKAIGFIDQKSGSPYGEIISEVFTRWNLQKSNVGILNSVLSTKHRFEMIEDIDVVKFSEMGLSAMSIDSLSDVKFHIPLGGYRHYNENGHLIDEKLSDRQETYDIIVKYVEHLIYNNQIGEKKEFRVIDGVLLRNHTLCF